MTDQNRKGVLFLVFSFVCIVVIVLSIRYLRSPLPSDYVQNSKQIANNKAVLSRPHTPPAFETTAPRYSTKPPQHQKAPVPPPSTISTKFQSWIEKLINNQEKENEKMPPLPSDEELALMGDGDIPLLPEQFPLEDRIGGNHYIDSLENIMNRANLPEEAKEESRKSQKDMETKGYIEVSDRAVEDFAKTKNNREVVRPWEEIVGTLLIKPASLENTPFKDTRLEGAYGAGGISDDGKYNEVVRFFSMPNGKTVELSETDHSFGGGGITAREAINKDVNGSPAIFVIEKGISGNAAVTTMTWITTERSYTLKMEGNVKENGMEKTFMDMARSIKDPDTGKKLEGTATR